MTDSESPLKRLLEASVDSPLTEADPASLDELMRRAEIAFNVRPILDLTDDHLIDCVRYYRAKGDKFAQLAKERADAEPKTKRKPATSIAEALARQSKEIEL